MNKIEYNDVIAFHPGYYVKEIIEDQGMTQDELAKRLQTSGKYVSELLNGKINLTDEMVLKLSTTFGTSTAMWLNLNKTFIEKKLEIERQQKEDAECELARQVDYKFWVELGVIEPAKKTVDKVRALQAYFKVASLRVLQEKNFLVPYRTTATEIKDVDVMNANAWVQTAINIGSQIAVDKFDKKKLNHYMAEIRGMTTQNSKDFYPRLKEMLAECGVALVILPTLKNCGVNGAVKWLGKDKVVLAINDGHKYADGFWFSLFHELGHVMQQRIKVLLVSETEEKHRLRTDRVIQKLEEEADVFAKNTLIPEYEYLNFLNGVTGFNETNVKEFAAKMNIHPGVVVDRLQKDRLLNYGTKLNSLKDKYYTV